MNTNNTAAATPTGTVWAAIIHSDVNHARLSLHLSVDGATREARKNWPDATVSPMVVQTTEDQFSLSVLSSMFSVSLIVFAESVGEPGDATLTLYAC